MKPSQKSGGFTPTRPFLIAHRGARVDAPENTISAFDRTIECGADGIEFDVRLTRDLVPIVFHDSDLTRICKSPSRISTLPYSDIKLIDAGSWFSRRYTGEQIPTLESVLVRYSGNIQLFIELKHEEYRDGYQGGASAMQHEVTRKTFAGIITDLICKHVSNDQMDSIKILSFDTALLDEVSKLLPGIGFVWNKNRAGDMWVKADGSITNRIPEGLWAQTLPFYRFSRGFAGACHRKGLFALTYSCNRPFSIRRAVEIGADGVMTDDPCRTISYFRRLVSRI